VAAVGKDILLFGVSMQIDEHLNPILILHHIFFDGVDLLAAIGMRYPPTAIEVITCNVASRVAQNDSVRIDHRDDFEDIFL